MKCDFQKTGDCGELICSGSITVQDVPELRLSLLESLENVDTLLLRFDDVTEVDISFLQILCSAHITAGKLKKEMKLAATSPAFAAAVEDSGFSRHYFCPLGTTGTCFWICGRYGEEGHFGQ